MLSQAPKPPGGKPSMVFYECQPLSEPMSHATTPCDCHVLLLYSRLDETLDGPGPISHELADGDIEASMQSRKPPPSAFVVLLRNIDHVFAKRDELVREMVELEAVDGGEGKVGKKTGDRARRGSWALRSSVMLEA